MRFRFLKPKELTSEEAARILKGLSKEHAAILRDKIGHHHDYCFKEQGKEAPPKEEQYGGTKTVQR